MLLPNPIPDNPLKWEGWRTYNSANLYERLCLDFRSRPAPGQIEENCRILLVWWQKKLPLKNQPSNPMAQLLRTGMDEAPHALAEARACLLDPARRAEHDAWVEAGLKQAACAEVEKFLNFAVAHGTIGRQDEANLLRVGMEFGLTGEEVGRFIEAKLTERGVSRATETEPAAAASGSSGDAFSEFRRMLRLSGLTDGDMTDDQRDAFCNMGENLGLTGGQAEDLIDEFLEETLLGPAASAPVAPVRPVQPARLAQPARPSPADIMAAARKPAASGPVSRKLVQAPTVAPSPHQDPGIVFSPLPPEQEIGKNPNFANSLGMQMLLVTSGQFFMGSTTPEAAPNEEPVSRVSVSCFHMARFPVTNAQYETFDPTHRAKRAQWADDLHPVVLVSHIEAVKFCHWLSSREKRVYRLPTESEWEYAARGRDDRNYPWGMLLRSGDLANFADTSSPVPWRDPDIDDGFAQTSPVGSFPAGAGPFGHEDLSGNVWEWCVDFYAPYSASGRINPRGPLNGTQRVLRGGSWKSRATNVRSSTRGFNIPGFSSNDVGFRVICQCQ
jgi:formylglycine-generating enzyme required for sulfatase activity